MLNIVVDKTRESTNSKIWPDSTCVISVRRKGQVLLVVDSLVLSTTENNFSVFENIFFTCCILTSIFAVFPDFLKASISRKLVLVMHCCFYWIHQRAANGLYDLNTFCFNQRSLVFFCIIGKITRTTVFL